MTIISHNEYLYDKKDRDSMFEAAVQMSAGDAGQRRIEAWLRDADLTSRVYVGVVGVLDERNRRLDAWAKVMVPGTGMFEHRELYIDFPSDAFLTKILLVTGGS